jgi:hypothetical protein
MEDPVISSQIEYFVFAETVKVSQLVGTEEKFVHSFDKIDDVL